MDNTTRTAPPGQQILVVAIHGILTSQTTASWPDRFDAWLFRRDPRIKVLKKEYRAGPFPRWNCRVRDPRLARGLVNEIELFLSTNGGAVPHPLSPPTWFLAHSNGAVIALLVTKRLIERGHWVGGVILTGAACEADVARNGVWDWLVSAPPQLGAAIAYASAADRVLAGDARALHGPDRTLGGIIRAWAWGKLIAPYGCLGRTGWLFHGKPWPAKAIGPALLTRWFAGGHSGYFHESAVEHTFEQIYRDITEPQPSRAAGHLSNTEHEEDI